MLSLFITTGHERDKLVVSLILGLVDLAKKATTKIVDSDTVRSILILKMDYKCFLCGFRNAR